MAYKIIKKKIFCSSCVAICSIRSIIEKCVEFGTCVAVCPVGAI